MKEKMDKILQDFKNKRILQKSPSPLLIKENRRKFSLIGSNQAANYLFKKLLLDDQSE